MKPKSTSVRRLVIVTAALLFAGGGYYVARYHAWAAYRDWSVARMNNLAREFLDAGDSRQALLTVRKVLRKRPNDLGALRLGVEAARASGAPEIVPLLQRLCQVERTTPNRLELIRVALQHRATGPALDAIAAMGEDARALPEFHRLAAETYLLAQRKIPAKYHLLNLLELEPGDGAARIALAGLEFETGMPADWVPRVRRLAADPATEVPALVLLLQQAQAGGDRAVLTELVARLRERTDLTLPQRLHLLAAMQTVDAVGATRLLADIQASAAASPADAAEVMGWFADQKRPADSAAWYPQLPEDTRNAETVKLMAAAALDQTGRWAELAELAGGARWPHAEALRLAFLTRALRQTGRNAQADETWEMALVAGGRDLRAASGLLHKVEAWKWTAERHGVLWKIFNLLPGSRSVREELIAHEFRDGNTVNLNKIYARILEAEPDDDEARNNFAYTSLLLGANVGRAAQIAKELHEKNPDTLSYLTTYTLALYRLDRPAEALAALQARPEARFTVSGLLHETVYAAAAGDFQRTADLLPQAKRVSMLPEERALLGAASVALARYDADARGEKIAADEPATGGDGWLALLPGRGSGAAEGMRAADTLYAQKNYSALAERLAAASWSDAEHLRHALAAYAAKELRLENRFRASWRQALAFARTPESLTELETLARRWDWPDERWEASERRFERAASDSALLAELLAHYRKQGRTADMARILWLHVDATRTSGPEAAWCVYYSLLCDMNVTTAQALAHRLYAAAPRASHNRLAYAFALWRQERAVEAWNLLQGATFNETSGLPALLIEAAVLSSLERKSEAKVKLAQFARSTALREELTLADDIARNLEKREDTMAANSIRVSLMHGVFPSPRDDFNMPTSD